MLTRLSILLWVAIVCFMGAWYCEAQAKPLVYVGMDYALMPIDADTIRIFMVNWGGR